MPARVDDADVRTGRSYVHGTRGADTDLPAVRCGLPLVALIADRGREPVLAEHILPGGDRLGHRSGGDGLRAAVARLCDSAHECLEVGPLPVERYVLVQLGNHGIRNHWGGAFAIKERLAELTDRPEGLADHLGERCPSEVDPTV